jgi:hypothetical protein
MLAGGEDLKTHSYLCRFGLPSVGNAERIFTLGAKGRSFLAERGLPMNWYFRPHKLPHFSHRHLAHNLVLTRFLVALNVWMRKQTDFTLSKIRFGHELTGTPGRVTVSGKTIPVIPDAWILISRTRISNDIPLMLEIDRGMEFQKRFKEHIRARIQFISSGGYERMFGSRSVKIYYATTGQIPEYRERRRVTMCLWTREVLEELRMQNWVDVFRFGSIEFAKLYDFTLFEKPVWHRADSSDPMTFLPP